MSGELEAEKIADAEAATRKKIAESNAINKASKSAAQAAIEAGTNANVDPSPEKVSEFEKTLDDLVETFRPKGEEFKNEGEALAHEIYLLLSALMAPVDLFFADKDIKGKLKEKFDDLKAKIKGDEPLLAVAETSTQPTPSADTSTTSADDISDEELDSADFLDEPDEQDESDLRAPPASITSPSTDTVEEEATALHAPIPRTITPLRDEAKDEANADPMVNTSSGNLQSLLSALENETQKNTWSIKDFKQTKSGIRLELEGGSKMYAKENPEGGLTYSLKRGMKAEARQNAIEKASQMSVDLAGPGATITISPKLPEAQQKAVYEAIQQAMEKPENRAKGLKIEGYTPPVSDILSTTPAAIRPRSSS